ncbi:MAG: serine hydrolase [Thermoanaerobaculia bacterium]|nr:serine hydrolase [Thermoanaerobaculia bacterium]
MKYDLTPIGASWPSLLTCLILGLLVGCGSPERSDPSEGDTAGPEPTLSSLADDLPGLLELSGVPGLAIAVVQDGELVMNEGFGVTDSDPDSGRQVTSDTIFEAASLSKAVVALRALQLVDAGSLNLDRPLSEIMPFDDVQDDPRVDTITARHILTHSTGFPNWRHDQPLTMSFDPGTEFSYSGEGFVLLGRVLEHLTGQSLAVTLQEGVFDPLGMTSSSFVWRPDYDRRSATGHDSFGTRREKQKPETANAAASLHTTATDYARLLAELLDSTLLTGDTARAMLSPQIVVEDGIAWGLGVGLETVTVNGHPETYVWHWGDNGVFRAFFAASPDRKRGVVYFTNSQNGLALVGEIVRRTLGDGSHPALAWLDYPSHDSPGFQAERRLLVAGLEGTDSFRSTFQAIAAELPSEADSVLDEGVLNRLGYTFLQRDAVDVAIAVFQQNVAQYPESSNAYDSLGEGYMRRGDRTVGDIEQAILNYEKSLQLDPGNANAKAMLAELTSAKP